MKHAAKDKAAVHAVAEHATARIADASRLAPTSQARWFAFVCLAIVVQASDYVFIESCPLES